MSDSGHLVKSISKLVPRRNVSVGKESKQSQRAEGNGQSVTETAMENVKREGQKKEWRANFRVEVDKK